MDNNNANAVEAPSTENAPGGAGELERTTARLFQVFSQDLSRAYDLCERFLGLFEKGADHLLPAVAKSIETGAQLQTLRAQIEMEQAQAQGVKAKAEAELLRAQARKHEAEADDIRADIEHRRREAGFGAHDAPASAF